MCSNRITCHRFPSPCGSRGRNNQQGFSLILVLFLLVVVSLLAVAMAQLNRGGQSAVSQEILSVRALFAAESGAQSMAMQIFPINGAGNVCPTAFVINFPAAAPGLSGCSADVRCASVSAAGHSVFRVISVGTCAASSTERASRTLHVGLRN